jgi:hypothetical protein
MPSEPDTQETKSFAQRAGETALFATVTFLEGLGLEPDHAAGWPWGDRDQFETAHHLAAYTIARKVEKAETLTLKAKELKLVDPLDYVTPLDLAAMDMFRAVVLAMEKVRLEAAPEARPEAVVLPPTDIKDTIFAPEKPFDALTDEAQALATWQAEQAKAAAASVSEGEALDLAAEPEGEKPDAETLTLAAEPEPGKPGRKPKARTAT